MPSTLTGAASEGMATRIPVSVDESEIVSRFDGNGKRHALTPGPLSHVGGEDAEPPESEVESLEDVHPAIRASVTSEAIAEFLIASVCQCPGLCVRAGDGAPSDCHWQSSSRFPT